MTWPTKKLGICILIIIIGIVTVVSIFEFPDLSSQFNVVALILTLIVLLRYAYDTHRIAEQTIETNLRPVVLRSGWIVDWKINSISDVSESKPMNLQFINLKNIAKDISGYVILNNKKYTLYFCNEISQEKLTDTNGREITKVGAIEKWGWIARGDKLYATFDKSKSENCSSENQIYISYQDIEGNRYFTSENKDFSQTSGKL